MGDLMTTTKFLKLSEKDFTDGIIQNDIYRALKEREQLLEHLYWLNTTLNRMNARVEEICKNWPKGDSDKK